MMTSSHPCAQTTPRLRFAPSPTGSLHVGGARTALFNYLYARANGGVFVLRVEDTDRERSTVAATEQMLASLKWLGINWDEGPGVDEVKKECGTHGPYFQSERLSVYNVHIEKLLTADLAYFCFCKNTELKAKRVLSESMGKPYVYDQKCRTLSLSEREALFKTEPHVIRFKTTPADVFFDDAVKGKMRFATDLIGDFVIRKSDGFPTYNFAVVVDDALMKITHVLRGDDHLSNTPRQLLLFKSLGYEPPCFAHVPMILGPRKEKLSKRDGATSVLEFANAGYYPDAFINHLALLGWSPEDGNEIISRSQLEKAFTALKFSSAPAVFDYKKLDHFNGHFIRSLDKTLALKDFKAFIKRDKTLEQYLVYPKIDELILELRGHCRKLGDILGELAKFFDPKADIAEAEKHWVESADARNLFELALQMFTQDTKTDFISHDEFKQFMQAAKVDLGLKGKQFFIPLRLKLMRRSSGIELDKYFEYMERKIIVARLS